LFNMWRVGAELLGVLKSEEAVDLLISHLRLSGHYYSTTMSQQPALRALIHIGPQAISKLSAVLHRSPDPDMRMDAVYCISSIGGPAALRALNTAVRAESNRCVQGFISASIDLLDKRTGERKNDNTKWLDAFNCREEQQSNFSPICGILRL